MTTERHSQAGEESLLSDPEEVAAAEALNAIRQFDFGIELLDEWLSGGPRPLIKPSHLLRMNRVLLAGIAKSAGTYRSVPIKITKSSHKPPEPYKVPELVEDMCDYINAHWSDCTAIHLAAYALWRINWIHPFVDGNGRTARIVSYIVLCAKIGYKLPGIRTIPEQISVDKAPYYKALESADLHYEGGKINVQTMERLLSEKLANQLLSAHDQATGGENTKGVHQPVVQKMYVELPVEHYERIAKTSNESRKT